MDSTPIIEQQNINVPASSLWKAITDKAEMKNWYFDLKEFRAEPGYKFRFVAGDEKEKYLHLCQVKEVIAEKKLSYTWAYEIIPGVETLVTFELKPLDNSSTQLKLTHAGVEKFPIENPSFRRESFVQGWKQIVSGLKKYLESKN